MMVRPEGGGPYPAVLHMHGAGDTVANNVEVLRILARGGYVAMDVEHRTLSARGGIDMQDIHTSVEFLSSSPHVRRGVIGLNGFSLGGRMALLVAARGKVLAVSAIAARTSSGSNPTVLNEASHLKVPVLLQHGTKDSVVPYNDAVLLEKKLLSLGRPVELIPYVGAGHTDLPWDLVFDKVVAFFRTHLR